MIMTHVQIYIVLITASRWPYIINKKKTKYNTRVTTKTSVYVLLHYGSCLYNIIQQTKLLYKNEQKIQ